MRVEPRYATDGSSRRYCRGLVLVCESEAESALVDECFGKAVDDHGLIARGHVEVRLSGDLSTHYLYTSPGPEALPPGGVEITERPA